MRRSIFAMGFVAMAALSMPWALQAHDSSSRRDGASQTMGSGMMKGNGQMGQMMDHCSQMMQGNSGRPNDQWRDSASPKGNPTEKQR